MRIGIWLTGPLALLGVMAASPGLAQTGGGGPAPSGDPRARGLDSPPPVAPGAPATMPRIETPNLPTTDTQVEAPTAPVTRAAREAETVPGNTREGLTQAYVLMLQDTALRLREAKQAAEQAPATQSGGAMTEPRQRLMHATRNAWVSMQRVPAFIAETEAYREAEREVRQAFGETTSPQPDRGGIAAAEQVLAVLDRLRATLARDAAAAGATVPAPPVATEGGAAARPR